MHRYRGRRGVALYIIDWSPSYYNATLSDVESVSRYRTSDKTRLMDSRTKGLIDWISNNRDKLSAIHIIDTLRTTGHVTFNTSWVDDRGRHPRPHSMMRSCNVYTPVNYTGSWCYSGGNQIDVYNALANNNELAIPLTEPYHTLSTPSTSIHILKDVLGDTYFDTTTRYISNSEMRKSVFLRPTQGVSSPNQGLDTPSVDLYLSYAKVVVASPRLEDFALGTMRSIQQYAGTRLHGTVLLDTLGSDVARTRTDKCHINYLQNECTKLGIKYEVASAYNL